MKRVFCTIPAYEGKLSAVTVASFFNDWPTCAQEGFALTLDQQIGSSDLPHARQYCLSRFLASGAEEWVTVDWDVGWEAGGLLKLLRPQVDVVMGAYPMKTDKEEFVIQFPDEKMRVEANGLAKIVAGPAGFLRVTRKAAEMMIIAYKDLRYRHEPSPTMGKLWGLFEKQLADGERVSEDISFIHRWTRLGEPAWVVPDLVMYHTGMKVWRGCLLEYQAKRQAA